MRNTHPILLIIAVLVPFLVFSQNHVNKLPKNFESFEIRSGTSIWSDTSRISTINDILGNDKNKFEANQSGQILTGIFKQRGWVKFDLESEVSDEVLIEINNPRLTNLKIYLTANNKIIERFEDLEKTNPISKRPFNSRNYVEKFRLDANKKYTIFICHDTGYLLTPFLIKIWHQEAFMLNQQSDKQFYGIFYGILILLSIICLIIWFFLKIRLFLIFGINVLSVLLFFLHLQGVLYQILPKGFISNNIYSLEILINYLSFLVQVLFVRGLTRLSQHKFKYIQKIYFLILCFIGVYFTFTLFSPLWVNYLSHQTIGFIKFIALLIFPLILIYFFVALFSSLKHSPFVKFYLVSCIIGITFYLAVMYSSLLNLSVSFDFNFVNSLITLFLIFVLMIGMIFQIRESFFQITIPKKQYEVNIEIRDDGNTLEKEEKTKTQTQIHTLTKRESEILKAFANGFSYTEIAEAMFISPHTARTHLKTIYRKLDINSKVEAVRWVMENEN